MSGMMHQIRNRIKETGFGALIRRYKWRYKFNCAILSAEVAKKAVEKHMPGATLEEKEETIKDILNMARKYRFSADEYFYYHFAERSEQERSVFVSDLNRAIFCDLVNQAKNQLIFDDKMKSVEVFGKYYRRDFCIVKSYAEIYKIEKFVQVHPKFILKPAYGSGGAGIQIVDTSESLDVQEKLKKLLDEYCSRGKNGFIAEEIIAQKAEMAQFHPASVNTVRVATVCYDEGVEVIAAFFRIGRGSGIVDNAGAGGVFGTVDVTTGEILAVADKLGNFYTNHPDTNIPVVGFVVPQWEEAVALAKELATVVKGNRYAGWDLALTERGWVMIEGNARGQFLWQIPTQKGFMEEANAILRRLKKPEMKN